MLRFKCRLQVYALIVLFSFFFVFTCKASEDLIRVLQVEYWHARKILFKCLNLATTVIDRIKILAILHFFFIIQEVRIKLAASRAPEATDGIAKLSKQRKVVYILYALMVIGVLIPRSLQVFVFRRRDPAIIYLKSTELASCAGFLILDFYLVFSRFLPTLVYFKNRRIESNRALDTT